MSAWVSSRSDLSYPELPSPAERAKTIAISSERAVLRPTRYRDIPKTKLTDREDCTAWLHHVHTSGSISVLLPETHKLAETARQHPNGSEILLELIDHAPVPLREPTRGLLWISGWLSPLNQMVARARALDIAESRPDHRLLDLGHGADLFRLTPTSLVLADSEGTHPLRPHSFTAAEADPFHAYERLWLPHLELRHREALKRLATTLPAQLRGERVRPLSLDRLGLRLRVETQHGDHDVRLPFSQSVECLPMLRVELHRLIDAVHLHETT